MSKLKILKAVVFVLTFLLFFGFIKLVSHTRGKPTPPANVTLKEPAHSRIDGMAAAGKKLYILAKGGDKADRIIIFDTETYQTISTININ